MSQRGFTLYEALMALLILAVAMVSILPAFISHVGTNTRNELRTGAVSAAQVRMEALRLEDTGAMPASGSSAPQLLAIDGREYEVVTHYCERAEYCSDDGTSKHLRVEVRYDGRAIYEVETVFTQLL